MVVVTPMVAGGVSMRVVQLVIAPMAVNPETATRILNVVFMGSLVWFSMAAPDEARPLPHSCRLSAEFKLMH